MSLTRGSTKLEWETDDSSVSINSARTKKLTNFKNKLNVSIISLQFATQNKSASGILLSVGN